MVEPYQDVRDPAYFRGVLGSMVHVDPGARTNPATIVRFGNTGHGIWPNYRVETATGSHSFRGSSHELDARAAVEEYADSRLSAPRFTLQGVQQLLQACIDRLGT